VIGEAAGADVAPSPPVVLATPAPAATEVAAVPVGERPVVASAGMADVSAPSVSEEAGADAGSVQPGGSLIAVRRSPEAPDPVFVLDDEQEDQSWDELCERAEVTVGSLQSSLEVLCRDVPKILQVMVSDIPFSFCERGVRRDALSPSRRT
jgi:hypothetical protein